MTIEAIQFYSQESEARDYLNWCQKAGGAGAPYFVVEMLQKILSKKEPFSGCKLLDLAAGPGTSISILSTLGFSEYVAIDSSPIMLKLCKEQTQGKSITVHELDIARSSFPMEDASVEMVTCCSSLVYVKDLDCVFKEAFRVLKKRGWFAFNLCMHDRGNDNFTFYDNDAIVTYMHSKKYVQSMIMKHGFFSMDSMGVKTPWQYIPGISSVEILFVLYKH